MYKRQQQPRPVVPIILTSEKPAEKVKEITARLEQGVQAIFDSDRYKEFLTAMSKFHDYSLNNTILIACLLYTSSRRNVWQINTASYRGGHFAAFPPKLAETCILAGCPVGGIVLDPVSYTHLPRK